MADICEIETLTFSQPYSFGRVTVYREGEWEPSGFFEAHGSVEIPKGSKLFLDISQDVCDDLRKIHAAPPRLLTGGINLSNKKLERADLRELSSLFPNSITITSCGTLCPAQLAHLGVLTSLEHLNLSGTLFEPPEFSWIPQFPNLRTLMLSGTGATSGCIAFLASLRSLQDLQLADCKITDQDVQSIWLFRSLKAINLMKCPITDGALGGIGNSESLISVSVPETDISDEGVEFLVAEVLRAGQKINSLTLRACRVTDKSLVRLASLKTLKFVDLYRTGVTLEGILFLKQSLPKCRVIVDAEKRIRKSF